MFESARAKIARAREHLGFLNNDFARFVGGDHYSLRKELDPETGDTLLIYDPTPLPPCWPLVIGELLYDLRSALDHVVFEIQGPEVEGSEFPIFRNRQAFFRRRDGVYDRGSGMYKIREIADAWVVYFIEAFQPYNGPKNHPPIDPERTSLWGLHLLSNIDKHRTLHLCQVRSAYNTVETPRFNSERSQVSFPRDLNERTVVGRLAPEDSEANVNFGFGPVITFDEGEEPAIVGYPVETICKNFVNQVTVVVDRIEAIASS